MAEKRPICNYSGIWKEIQSGDTIDPAVLGSSSDEATLQNIQGLMLRLAIQGNLPFGQMANGFFDIYQDTSGIDAALSSGYVKTSEHYTPDEDGIAQDVTITSAGVSSGDVLIQDVRGSITTWTKDSTASGHFNVANASVEPGCIITFADLTTAVIWTKSGDGTGVDSVTISVDHATDNSLTSITGLKFSSSNLTMDYGWGSLTETWADTLNANSGTNYTGYTLRQVVLGSQITTSGNRARVTLEAPASQSLTLDNVSIGERTGAESAITGTFGSATFKELLFSGVSGCTTGAGTTITSDWLEFDIDETKDYVVVMDFAASTQYPRIVTSGGGGIGSKSATNSYNVAAPSGVTFTASYTFHVVKLEIMVKVPPTAVFAAHTNTIQVDTSDWFGIYSISATQTTPGSSVIYHAVSFNKGNAAEIWKVYLSSTWRDIAKLDAGTWKYRDAAGDWQSATVNSRLGALGQAFGVTENQLNATALAAITSAQWATPFVAGTLDLACGLKASGTVVPLISKWTANYLVPMVLVSEDITAAAVATSALASILVKNKDASTKVFVSTATSPSWTELTGLTEVGTQFGISGVSQYATDNEAISGSADKSMRLKIVTEPGHSTEIHGACLIWT